MNLFLSEEQWQQIDALGCKVEERLQDLGVGLMMGGEPTYVSANDFESPQWRTEALGEDKRRIAGEMLERLQRRYAESGALRLYGVGKLYPDEASPRWALGCYWRSDGLPLWTAPELVADEGTPGHFTLAEARAFIENLARRLSVPADCILTARERDLASPIGYTLPLLAIDKNGEVCWSSCRWILPDRDLILVPGQSPSGLRLPLNRISWHNPLEREAIASLESLPLHRPPTPSLSPPNSISVAFNLEVREGILCVFLPPIGSTGSYLDLVAAIEATAAALSIPVLLEGYPPPPHPYLRGFQITPDPGVLEVNIHPAPNWRSLVQIHTTLEQEAQRCGLIAEKYTREGLCVDTGGGAHITIGGESAIASPLLRRPDLLRSFIAYFQNNPSLSYLFSGQFVGSTSQAPRLDESHPETLYELEIAFQALQPFKSIPPEVVDRLLQPLLVDATGNAHRTALCIDKLFPAQNFRSRLGLLEFRAFAMPPEVRVRLLQMLLIRALTVRFWEQPYQEPLQRWGTQLRDRFLLPHFLKENLAIVLNDLEAVGLAFQLDWFEPFVEFRFPRYGALEVEGVQLELRRAIEPWWVIGDATSVGNSRPVDASMERIQVSLQEPPREGAQETRYLITCNGYPVPLMATAIPGLSVGGVRFRAQSLFGGIHAAFNSHTPLTFELLEKATWRSLGGCRSVVEAALTKGESVLPHNRDSARERLQSRFIPDSSRREPQEVSPAVLHPDSPLTLDLRWWG